MLAAVALTPNPYNQDFTSQTGGLFAPHLWESSFTDPTRPLITWFIRNSYLLTDPGISGWLFIALLTCVSLSSLLVISFVPWMTVSLVIGFPLVTIIKVRARGVKLPRAWKYKESITGRNVVITGASSGIGEATVMQLLEMNPHKILIGNRRKVELDRFSSIAKLLQSSTQIDWHSLDLNDEESIHQFADYAKSIFDGSIHVLFNNSGILCDKFEYSKNRREKTLQVNHIGPAMLTDLLLPSLIQSGSKANPARVINTSSLGYLWSIGTYQCQKRVTPELIHQAFSAKNEEKEQYDPCFWYGISKFCSIVYGKQLQQRANASGDNVLFLSYHPGAVATEIMEDFKLFRGPWLSWLNKFPWSFLMKTATEGSQTGLLLATFPAEKLSGGGFYVECSELGLVSECYDIDVQKTVWDITLKRE